MAGRKSQETQFVTMMVIFLTFSGMILLILLWMGNPKGLVGGYSLMRQIETFGLWHYLPFAGEFGTMKANGDALAEMHGGRGQGGYSILPFFKTSLPFAVLSIIAIIAIGMLAVSKVSDDHIDRFISHREPPDHQTILEKFALWKPTCRFVLDYQNYELSSFRGAGRLPYSPLTFLYEHGMIRRIGKPMDWKDDPEWLDFSAESSLSADSTPPFPYLKTDKKAIIDFYSSEFGPRNPFLNLPSLSRIDTVKAAIDEIPWYFVVLLAPALTRIHQSIFFNEKAYVKSVVDLHKFPDKVWADLNAFKKRERDRLRLGFDDERHRASEQSLYVEKLGKKGPSAEPLVTLAEYLAEEITPEKGQEPVIRAETMPSVKEARVMLLDTLTAHLVEERGAYPVGQDKKTEAFIYSSKAPKSAVETAYFAKVSGRMQEASDKLLEILQRNGYVFGLVGSALEETRKLGVFHPPPWRWMRFVNILHWRFVLDMGKPMPTVDSLGMFEHYTTEKSLERPLYEPFLRRTPFDLGQQAARFVTKDFIALYLRNNAMDDVAAEDIFDAALREQDKAEKNSQPAFTAAELDGGEATASDFAATALKIKEKTKRTVS